MGPLNQMNRFILNLANQCAPLRRPLRRTYERKWDREKERTFQTIKKETQTFTEIKHFKKNQPMRIVCDASMEGLVAVLQKKTHLGWKAFC